jgi:putative transposase
MIYEGLHITSKDGKTNLLVCHTFHSLKLAAVSDLNIALKKDNIPKPEIECISELLTRVHKEDLNLQLFEYPAEMSFSDKILLRENRDKWIQKRDTKFEQIKPLITDDLIIKYLYGEGINSEINELLTDPHSHWTTRGAYYNTLNRYIVFGCTHNALLPFKLKACGSNYLHIKSPSKENIKRGRSGKDNRNSRSKSTGITCAHKDAMRQVITFERKTQTKFSITHAMKTYRERFENHVVERDIEGHTHRTYIPFDEDKTLSDRQLRYHFDKLLSRPELLKLKHGNIAYEKDFADRQGDAHDGVIGATHRYEIDATILDVYVRFPYDTTGTKTMGRPVLYVVIDVYSTMIVGMYLGFDGPNWQGASQALVNACMDKTEFCLRYGIPQDIINWPAAHIPVQITVDNGTEHTDGVIRAVLKQEIGVRAYNFVAVFRGDAKGIVERTFGTLNSQVVHFIAGAIPDKGQRGEQHPSNKTEYDYDNLVKLLILEIQTYNNSADRIKRLDANAIRTDIDITPQALFLHSLNQEMNGGRPSSEVEAGKIRWAFLPEETASVRPEGIYFKGLIYHSDFAKQANWYSRAKHHGSFKITVKRLRDWSSHIWHKTADGQYVFFYLKNTNNESPFLNMHWEPLLHLLEQFKDKQHQNQLNRRKLLAFKQGLIEQLEKDNHTQMEGQPENTRISIQPGIRANKITQKAIEQLAHAIEVYMELSNAEIPEGPDKNKLESSDDELFQ